MAEGLIINPYGQDTASMKRPYCAVCGFTYTNPKFGGKVIIAWEAGKDGKPEIIFCEKCSHTEEAQEVFREKTRRVFLA